MFFVQKFLRDTSKVATESSIPASGTNVTLRALPDIFSRLKQNFSSTTFVHL